MGGVLIKWMMPYHNFLSFLTRAQGPLFYSVVNVFIILLMVQSCEHSDADVLRNHGKQTIVLRVVHNKLKHLVIVKNNTIDNKTILIFFLN